LDSSSFHRVRGALEPLRQLLRVTEGVPTFFVAVAVEYGHQVEQLAAPQRVVHQVRFLAAPQRDVGAVQVVGHFGPRQHGAVSNVARHMRLAVANDRFAHAAPQAIGTDQCGAAQMPAIGQLHLDAAVTLRESGELALHLQVNQRQRAAGVEHHLVQIGAVDHAVGMSVGGQRLFTGRRPHHQLASAHVAHHQVRREIRYGVNRVAQTQMVEHAEHVGAELDASADFAERIGLLQHLDLKALAR
jgi:hypothetical protein